MAVTPAGSLSLAQEHLRVMLADSTTFRQLVEASDRTSALVHLYHEGLPAPADGTEHTPEEHEALRPWGIVYTEDRNGFRRRAVSTGGFRSGGRLKLRLCRTCPELIGDEPTSEANLQWKNIIGGIIADLCNMAIEGDPDHLVFEEISLDFGPFCSAPELAVTQGVWQGAELGVAWGGQ